MVKKFISSMMFAVAHIRTHNDNQISWFTAFKEWLYNERMTRRMNKTTDMVERHFIRDCFNPKFIPKRDSLNRNLTTLKRR